MNFVVDYVSAHFNLLGNGACYKTCSVHILIWFFVFCEKFYFTNNLVFWNQQCGLSVALICLIALCLFLYSYAVIVFVFYMFIFWLFITVFSTGVTTVVYYVFTCRFYYMTDCERRDRVFEKEENVHSFVTKKACSLIFGLSSNVVWI